MSSFFFDYFKLFFDYFLKKQQTRFFLCNYWTGNLTYLQLIRRALMDIVFVRCIRYGEKSFKTAS